jgi:transposase
MTLVAEIGAIGRFPTARKLGAWAGLTPRCATCDRKLRHGHLTKQGSPRGARDPARGRPDGQAPPMVASADGQLAWRRGHHIATTATARRRLARCFHILPQLETAPTPEQAGTGRARGGA